MKWMHALNTRTRPARVSTRTLASHRAAFLLGLLVLLPLMISPAAWALVFSATVDTTQVRFGESLRLTLRIDESSKGNEPDLSVLDKDFKVLGKQFGSSTNLSSRGINTETNWIVNLMPKRKGTLTIPAIDFDGVLSKPINITVTDATQPGTAQSGAAQNSQQLVFLEAEVDTQAVYVQQQVNFTLRLYHRTDLHEPSLTMPDVEDAVQEKLGSPRAYTKVIDGREYEVVENRFAYFPQKSGTFLIPPAELTATIAAGGNSFLDPFLGMMGKPIRRVSNGIEVQVRPKPDSYPTTAAWLPTPHLSIEESIKPDKQDFKVGEPISRVVTMEAAGVAPSLLPPLSVPEGAGFKVYPEQPDTRSLPDANGVSSRRVETHAYIPTQAGTLTLPAIEISYWNTLEDRLDKAVLPSRTFNITGAPVANTQAIAPTELAPTDNARDQMPTAPSAIVPVVAGNNPWQWAALSMLTAWLLTLALWLLQIRQRTTKSSLLHTNDEANEAISRKRDALMNACKQQQPVAARKALVTWFKAVDSTHAIHSLGHVRQHAMSALLASATHELEQTLYRPTDGISWNSDALRKGIADEESQRRIKQRERKSQLQNLHP